MMDPVNVGILASVCLSVGFLAGAVWKSLHGGEE